MNRWLKKLLRPQLEVELTTRCPIQCLLCPQSRPEDHYPGWNHGDLDPEVLWQLLAVDPALRKLIFCGAYGDPIYHRDFLGIMTRLARDHARLDVYVETNGSYRPPEWWESLGRMTTPKHTFCFSIDGLADSNPLYRRNADWVSMERGLRAFRPLHRGQMHWKWILFSHNQHQVEQGFRLSRELGFDSFKVVESQRHTHATRPTTKLAEVLARLKPLQNETSV